MSGDRQYGFDTVEASWTVPGFPGIDLKNGAADGTPIVESRTAPRFSMREDGMGNVLFVFNPGKSGTLTLTVTQESKLHQVLSERMILDEKVRNQIGPILLTDNSTGETFLFINARLITEPNMSRGKEGVTFDWVFGFARREHAPNSSDQNLVGG